MRNYKQRIVNIYNESVFPMLQQRTAEHGHPCTLATVMGRLEPYGFEVSMDEIHGIFALTMTDAPSVGVGIVTTKVVFSHAVQYPQAVQGNTIGTPRVSWEEGKNWALIARKMELACGGIAQ